MDENTPHNPWENMNVPRKKDVSLNDLVQATKELGVNEGTGWMERQQRFIKDRFQCSEMSVTTDIEKSKGKKPIIGITYDQADALLPIFGINSNSFMINIDEIPLFASIENLTYNENSAPITVEVVSLKNTKTKTPNHIAVTDEVIKQLGNTYDGIRITELFYNLGDLSLDDLSQTNS